jgi:hypothetical protein
MGNPERAMDFLNLDAGSAFYKSNFVRMMVREGKIAEARAAAQQLPGGTRDNAYYKACFDRPPNQPPPAELSKMARALEPTLGANPDPENRYLFATDLAFCGETDMSLRLIKSAIESNYCVYEALQKDPLLAPLHSSPEYPKLLSEAKACQDKFLAERAKPAR